MAQTRTSGEVTSPTPLEVLDEGAVRRWVFRARSALAANRERLDRLNVFPVPDGDTGTNMYLTLHSALESLIGMYLSGGPTRILEGTQAMARSTLLSARGNSGVILSQLVRGLAEVVTEASARAAELHCDQQEPRPVEGIDGSMLARALRASSERAWQGVTNPVEGTILTVAKAAADSAQAALRWDSSLVSVTAAALDGARTALAATPALLPSLAKAGVVDAGGAGYVLILIALHEIVTGRVVEPVLDALPGARLDSEAIPDPGDNDRLAVPGVGPAFEVMYLLDGCVDGDADRLRGDLLAIGDSVLVVGSRELRTVHVHTDEAGHAIEAGLDCGRVYGIRISSLREGNDGVRAGTHTLPCPVGPIPPGGLPRLGPAPEGDPSNGSLSRAHPGIHHRDADVRSGRAVGSLVTPAPASSGLSMPNLTQPGAAVPASRTAGTSEGMVAGPASGLVSSAGVACLAAGSDVAVVACAAGPGLAEAFRESGATPVWTGAGARPTPEDIVRAVRATGARQVVILPNDGDVVMAADVAAEIAGEDGIDARVVATRWAVSGLAAVAVFGPELPVDEAVIRMSDAAEQVRPGMVVVASRVAHTDVGWCREGDVLGFVGSTAVVIGADLLTVAREVFDRLDTPGTELLTAVAGADHSDVLWALAANLAESHPDLEVSLLEGGQPAFALLLGVE